jgi:hypothetical protein
MRTDRMSLFKSNKFLRHKGRNTKASETFRNTFFFLRHYQLHFFMNAEKNMTVFRQFIRDNIFVELKR